MPRLKLQYPTCYVSFIHLLKYQTIGSSNGILRPIVASVITHCQLPLLWRHIRESFLSSALVDRRFLVLFLDRMKYCSIVCILNRKAVSNVKFSPPADLLDGTFFSFSELKYFVLASLKIIEGTKARPVFKIWFTRHYLLRGCFWREQLNLLKRTER